MKALLKALGVMLVACSLAGPGWAAEFKR